jgi:tetratricopeptide (TPR) repeat protein
MKALRTLAIGALAGVACLGARFLDYHHDGRLEAIPVAASAATPESDFQAGEQATATKNYAAALPRFEAALRADPDSLRFASEYRMAVIAAKAHDRALDFFKQLTLDHPQSAAAALNYGFAYVDKVPAAGSVTKVILANNALTWFSRSVALQPTWLSLFTRGNSYLYWPKVFGRTSLSVADLEAAIKMSQAASKRPYHARAWISLGDGYWKLDDLEKARATWSEGLKTFPDNPELKARLSRQGDDLKSYIEDQLDSNKRVDTDLRPIWIEP